MVRQSAVFTVFVDNLNVCSDPALGALLDRLSAMSGAGTATISGSASLLDKLDVLVIENVGNLVCPADYDLGEDLRVVLLSVTEGEDKPLKYPPMFHSAQVAVVTKSDMAAAAGFDRKLALENLNRVSHHARIFELSAKTGDGMKPWLDFLAQQRAA